MGTVKVVGGDKAANKASGGLAGFRKKLTGGELRGHDLETRGSRNQRKLCMSCAEVVRSRGGRYSSRTLNQDLICPFEICRNNMVAGASFWSKSNFHGVFKLWNPDMPF